MIRGRDADGNCSRKCAHLLRCFDETKYERFHEIFDEVSKAVGSGEATRHSRRLEARRFGGVRFRWNQMRLADEVSFDTTLQPLSILFETALRRSVRACSPAAPYRSSTASWRPLMDPRASCSPRMPSNPSFARARRLARAPLFKRVVSARAHRPQDSTITFPKAVMTGAVAFPTHWDL